LIIKNIFQYLDVKKYINTPILIEICKIGNINFINWLLNIDFDLTHFVYIIFNTFVIYEHYDQAIYFYNLKDYKNEIDLTNNNFNLIINVIKNNNLFMLKWIMKKFNDYENLQFIIHLEYNENIFLYIKYDNSSILNYLINKYKLNNYKFIKNLYTYCIENYYSNNLIYLMKNFDIIQYNLDLDYKKVFFNALNEKNEELLDLVIKHVKNVNWLFLVCINKDNEHILNYLLENYYEYLNINQELFYNILYLGNINYLKLFVKYCIKEINFDLINEDDYFILFSYNNIEILDYLLTFKKIKFDNQINILKLTISLGKFKITKWLLQNFDFDNLHDEEDYCFTSCIIYKNLELLILLEQFDTNFNKYKYNYLVTASKVDDLSIFVWLSSKFETIDYAFNDYELIVNALKYHNTYVFKYILNKFNDFDINFNNGLIITTVFGYNYYDIIYYLLDKYKNIDVLVQNEIIMKYAIEDGNIEILNLLYDYNNKFDLSINQEYLFRTATKMNHIYVVQWLLTKKKDINYQINNHELFYYVCEHNFVEMALFFSSLNNDLYKVEVNVNNELISYLVNKKLIINEISKNKIETIEKCPICLDQKSTLITNCNHQYCYDCLDLLNKKNSELKCVYCRNDIIEIQQIKN
jgi:hypothetical protein